MSLSQMTSCYPADTTALAQHRRATRVKSRTSTIRRPKSEGESDRTNGACTGWRQDSSMREQARLSIIAPSGPEGSYGCPSIPLPKTSRSRLLPRSRSGCWTCRLRKVKCDEQRPTCGQCSRLGHNCDYNLRLAFRDDTPRVIERMLEIRMAGSSVWDPRIRGVKYGANRLHEDSLPAFATLTSDEDREKKAELHGPGTYLVVANLSTFTSLPEFCKNAATTAITPLITNFETHLDVGSSEASQIPSPVESEDPNIVILKTFEDNTPYTPFQHLPFILLTNRSQIPQARHTMENSQTAFLLSNLEIPMLSRIDEARHGGRDAQLLQHYRSTISPTVILFGRPEVGEDLFEHEARTFPPLFHAMMAVSALSLANRNNVHHADALEHYQQVIPAMRSTVQSREDFASDGALFTHYLLLIYEIANSGNWQVNMWQTHCDRLFSIVTIRQQANGTEPYSYLAWTVSLIDLYALLSGSGNGTFVEEALKQSMVSPTSCLPPPITGQVERFYPEEMPYFPALLELNQQVVKLAVQIGRMARDLRAEASYRTLRGPMAHGPERGYLMNRLARVRGMHNICRECSNSWVAIYPQFWPRYRGPEPLPYRVQGSLEQAQSLYIASIIYTHTSMYPGQISDRGQEYDIDVPACATKIIEIGRQIVAEERWECRYITFGLFMAGFASTNLAEKALAFDLFDHVEQHCHGGNTTAMKQFLSTIYARQQDADRSGRALEIDWIEEMRARNMKLVMFGL